VPVSPPMPASARSIAVNGKADKGWRSGSKRLTLDGKAVHSPLNGAALTAGKKYTLTGAITFRNGRLGETVRAKLTFRSCPNP